MFDELRQSELLNQADNISTIMCQWGKSNKWSPREMAYACYMSVANTVLAHVEAKDLFQVRAELERINGHCLAVSTEAAFQISREKSNES